MACLKGGNTLFLNVVFKRYYVQKETVKHFLLSADAVLAFTDDSHLAPLR